MTEQRVSSRYARALLDTSEKENISSEIYANMQLVEKTLNDSHEFRIFTSSPVIQHWRKKEVYRAVFEGKIHTLALNFLLFLLDKKRGELILSIVTQFEIQYNEINKILPVEIISTIEMTDELKTKMVEKISLTSGKKVVPKFKTDAMLKGGALVKINDWIYDASVKHQLEILHKKLAEENII